MPSAWIQTGRGAARPLTRPEGGRPSSAQITRPSGREGSSRSSGASEVAKGRRKANASSGGRGAGRSHAQAACAARAREVRGAVDHRLPQHERVRASHGARQGGRRRRAQAGGDDAGSPVDSRTSSTAARASSTPLGRASSGSPRNPRAAVVEAERGSRRRRARGELARSVRAELLPEAGNDDGAATRVRAVAERVDGGNRPIEGLRVPPLLPRCPPRGRRPRPRGRGLPWSCFSNLARGVAAARERVVVRIGSQAVARRCGSGWTEPVAPATAPQISRLGPSTTKRTCDPRLSRTMRSIRKAVARRTTGGTSPGVPRSAPTIRARCQAGSNPLQVQHQVALSALLASRRRITLGR
jgi:hypothetical protein